MLREQPLTCLFLAATVIVDLVILTMLRIPYSQLGWFVGFVLGQAAMLAHWAAMGGTLRLARGAWLVPLVGLLASLGSNKTPDSIGTWAAFLAGYVLILVFAALLVQLSRFYFNKNLEPDLAKNRWRISVIELFGWTIVVAIVSYGIRFMDFEFVRATNAFAGKMVALVAVPVAITLGVKNDLRDLNRTTSFLTVVAFIGSAYYLTQRYNGTRFWLIAVQSSYLLGWFFVIGLDSVMREARAVKEAAETQTSRR